MSNTELTKGGDISLPARYYQ